MHMRTRTALLLTALFFTGIASGTELERASPFWVKSFFAKKNQNHACIYATVTSQQELLNGEPRLYFDRIDKKGFSTAMFMVVKSKAKDRLGLNNEMGDVLEACLVPGDYIISAIVVFEILQKFENDEKCPWIENFPSGEGGKAINLTKYDKRYNIRNKIMLSKDIENINDRLHI